MRNRHCPLPLGRHSAQRLAAEPRPYATLVNCLLAFLCLPALLTAQDTPANAPLTSGPAAGTVLTPVACYATNAQNQGQDFDAAKKLGKASSAFLFIHELTRNTAPVLRGLDNLASEFAIVGFRSFSIMLSGERTAAEAQLQRVNGFLRLTNPIVLSTDGPGNYALNRKASLTFVFAKNGVVHKSLVLTDTGLEPARRHHELPAHP